MQAHSIDMVHTRQTQFTAPAIQNTKATATAIPAQKIRSLTDNDMAHEGGKARITQRSLNRPIQLIGHGHSVAPTIEKRDKTNRENTAYDEKNGVAKEDLCHELVGTRINIS